MAKFPRLPEHIIVTGGPPTSDLLATLDSGVQIPTTSKSTVVLHENFEPRYELVVDLAVEDGQPVVVGLSIRAFPGANHVTATLLRELNLRLIVSQLVGALGVFQLLPQMAARGGPGMSTQSVQDILAAATSTSKRRPITPDLLAEVAAVYRAAIEADAGSGKRIAPTEAVAGHFHVSPRTATRWVARASDKNLLPRTTKGRVRRTDGKH